MNRTVRKIAFIVAHVGILLAIAYLAFFLIISVRTSRAERDGAEGQDVYLIQTMHERDFSVYNVGKALSEHSDPVRENVFMAADLVIPAVCLASGILIQFAATRKRHKNRNVQQPTETKPTRR